DAPFFRPLLESLSRLRRERPEWDPAEQGPARTPPGPVSRPAVFASVRASARPPVQRTPARPLLPPSPHFASCGWAPAEAVVRAGALEVLARVQPRPQPAESPCQQAPSQTID